MHGSPYAVNTVVHFDATPLFFHAVYRFPTLLLCPPPNYGTTSRLFSLLNHSSTIPSTSSNDNGLTETMPPRWKSDYGRKPPRFAWFRSCLPLLLITILFSFLLSSVALLSHFRSPAAQQQLGWQAWDVVEMRYAGKAVSKGNTTEESEVFAPSIPLDVWVRQPKKELLS